MEENIIVALIGLFGVIAGVTITSIIQYLSARQKIEELKLSHAQKIQEKMLESARNHLDNLYLPLYKKISSLHYNFTIYRNEHKIVKKEKIKDQKDFKKSLETFRNSINDFDINVQEIFESGDTAYLIGTLEERLIEFRDFLNKSKTETKGIIEEEITTTIGTSIFGIELRKTFTKTKEKSISRLHEKIGKILFFPRLSPTVEVIIEKRLLKAPISSDEFEKQLHQYLMEIKREIKEVTLWMKK